jgi:Ca2+-binding EF-hand superfamily protein
MAAPHLEKVRDMFERYDVDHDDSLTINEVATLLAELGNKITSLPAVRFTLYFCVDQSC